MLRWKAMTHATSFVSENWQDGNKPRWNSSDWVISAYDFISKYNLPLFHKYEPNQRAHQNLIQFASKKIWITIVASMGCYCCVRLIVMPFLLKFRNTYPSLCGRCISACDTLEGCGPRGWSVFKWVCECQGCYMHDFSSNTPSIAKHTSVHYISNKV